MKKKQSEYERFMALTDAQKDAEVALFDKPLPLGPDGLAGLPLRASDKALHRVANARGKAGRPKIGKGAKIVPISIEQGLLREANAWAKLHQVNRSQMVAQGLRLLMSQARTRAKAG